MIYQLNLHPGPFERIKSGDKTIEMRLHDENKSLIKIGDVIEFTNRDTKETLKVDVVDIKIYNDFDELYRHYNKKELGYLEEEKSDPDDMLIYYSKDRIQKYGVMAIKITLKK